MQWVTLCVNNKFVSKSDTAHVFVHIYKIFLDVFHMTPKLLTLLLKTAQNLKSVQFIALNASIAVFNNWLRRYDP